MQREYRKWKSPSLGRDMEILVFGTEGTPVLIFPTEYGRFFEWEDQGMMDGVEEQINRGYNHFFCLDSVVEESFLNQEVDPYTRVMRHSQYLVYVLEEVLPFISDLNANPYIINAGVGLGAYYSLLLALKYPTSFQKVLALSGYYDINAYLDGFKDDNAYYNNPIEFVPNLHDERILKQVRMLDIRLLSFLNDPNRNATQHMSDTLWLKSIEHAHYVWDEEASDRWTLIPVMFRAHLF